MHSEAQEEEAQKSWSRVASTHGRPLVTRIRPYTGFTRAEDYHQKYYLRRDPFLMKAFRHLFPDEEAFADSTAAARVNGFLAGYGDPAVFNGREPLWGLSDEAWERLRKIAAGRFF